MVGSYFSTKMPCTNCTVCAHTRTNKHVWKRVDTVNNGESSHRQRWDEYTILNSTYDLYHLTSTLNESECLNSMIWYLDWIAKPLLLNELTKAKHQRQLVVAIQIHECTVRMHQQCLLTPQIDKGPFVDFTWRYWGYQIQYRWRLFVPSMQTEKSSQN